MTDTSFLQPPPRKKGSQTSPAREARQRCHMHAPPCSHASTSSTRGRKRKKKEKTEHSSLLTCGCHTSSCTLARACDTYQTNGMRSSLRSLLRSIAVEVRSWLHLRLTYKRGKTVTASTGTRRSFPHEWYSGSKTAAIRSTLAAPGVAFRNTAYRPSPWEPADALVAGRAAPFLTPLTRDLRDRPATPVSVTRFLGATAESGR